jgi:hypothetical protein
VHFSFIFPCHIGSGHGKKRGNMSVNLFVGIKKCRGGCSLCQGSTDFGFLKIIFLD